MRFLGECDVSMQLVQYRKRGEGGSVSQLVSYKHSSVADFFTSQS